MHTLLWRERVHIGLIRGVDEVLEKPALGEHAQSSTGDLKTNYLVENIMSYIVNRDAISAYDLIKKFDQWQPETRFED